MKKLCAYWLILGSLIFSLASPAQAISLIRDTETEQLIRDYSNPIFRAAELDPDTIRIFIVNDSAINAFVAGGANMFVHTGLILASERPEVLMGVIAHETGHIAGGHLARGTEALEDAQLSTILSYVLGAAAGLAGGGEAAAGILSAGQHVAQRNLLSFTRVNEQAADQAALKYLDETNISAAGLLELMERLRTRETVYNQNIDPYALTHPLSKERIAHIRGHLLQQGEKGGKISPAIQKRHERVLGKLRGFLQNPQTVLNYRASDSVSDQIARVVAYHRLSQTSAALKGINALLLREPNNAYWIELKAQILSESGREAEALPLYRKASILKPESGLLRTYYAKMLLATDKSNASKAVAELRKASQQDRTNPLTWRLLGQAEAALGQDGNAALAYAEAALLNNNSDLARRYASEALEKLQKASPALLRAQDVREEAIRLQKEKAKREKR